MHRKGTTGRAGTTRAAERSDNGPTHADTFAIYEYAVFGTALAYFVSYRGIILNMAVIFALILILNEDEFRKKLSPLKTTHREMAIGIAAIALPFILYFVEKYIDIGLVADFGSMDYLALLIGVTLFFWGLRGLYVLLLPFMASITLVLAGYIESTSVFREYIGPPFIYYSTHLTGAILSGMGYNIFTGPDYFFLPNGTKVIVLIWCSGISGVLLFIILMSFVLWYMPIQPDVKASIIILGSVGQFFVNILRLVILLLLAIHFDLNVMEAFHSGLGDILFVLYFIGVYMLVEKYAQETEHMDTVDGTAGTDK